jgi:hypothetical protein
VGQFLLCVCGIDQLSYSKFPLCPPDHQDYTLDVALEVGGVFTLAEVSYADLRSGSRAGNLSG